jgi:hypothetical protein
VTLTCENCRTKQAACPVCWMNESPYTESPLGTRLRSQCLLCIHGGHAACMREMLVVEKLGGCPTAGCLCDCTEGSWRDELDRMAESAHEKQAVVKKDGCVAKESSAVAALRK